MNAFVSGTCRKAPCHNSIPSALANEQLCLDHFLEEASRRAAHMLDLCRQKYELGRKDVEWLLSDALVIVTNLEQDSPHAVNLELRERMLDLLLIHANVHEYVGRGSARANFLS
jgi:hypothetical protein